MACRSNSSRGQNRKYTDIGPDIDKGCTWGQATQQVLCRSGFVYAIGKEVETNGFTQTRNKEGATVTSTNIDILIREISLEHDSGKPGFAGQPWWTKAKHSGQEIEP